MDILKLAVSRVNVNYIMKVEIWYIQFELRYECRNNMIKMEMTQMYCKLNDKDWYDINVI